MLHLVPESEIASHLGPPPILVFTALISQCPLTHPSGLCLISAGKHRAPIPALCSAAPCQEAILHPSVLRLFRPLLMRSSLVSCSPGPSSLSCW